MGLFQYIGDPLDEDDRTYGITAFGFEFTRGGQLVEVPESGVAEKLRGNRHFREAELERSCLDTQTLKQALLKQADMIGVEVDRRWGVDRLKAAIAEAEAA